MKFLLDTNVVSEPLRPFPNARVLRNLRRYENEIAIASVVWHELRYGVERLPPSHRRYAIGRYLEDVVLASMPILDYNDAAADWHAVELARLAAAGDTPPFADGQIAAIAKTRNLQLVTFNEADFRRFKGLKVVTWR